MNDDKKILFLERLTKLLNGTIKEKEQSTIESEEFCDALKWKLSRIMEEIYKLDYLSDDFELSSFVSSHIVAPIERMKEQMDKPWLKDKLTIGLLGHCGNNLLLLLNLRNRCTVYLCNSPEVFSLSNLTSSHIDFVISPSLLLSKIPSAKSNSISIASSLVRIPSINAVFTKVI